MERNINIISLWQGLHTSLETWDQRGEGQPEELTELQDQAVWSQLKSLREFPAERWKMIGNGAGWTQISAMALSWCQGATLKDVLNAWEQAGHINSEIQHVILAAQMTCPNILPAPIFSEIMKSSQNINSIWVLMHTFNYYKIPINFNFSKEKLMNLHPLIKELYLENCKWSYHDLVRDN